MFWVYSLNVSWPVSFEYLVPIFSVNQIATDLHRLFLYCTATLLFQLRGGSSAHKLVVVLLNHCPWIGNGWDPATMFNPATFCMYVPVPSQIIQWLSFVAVLLLCFSFTLFYTLIRPLVFSFELFYICHFGAFYSLLCGMGFAHCFRPYGDL